ncbi:CRTAC1 family protein [Pelagicoccus mobilis]|uniref:CRTAC1 family protein n=1 Tax=Pelagicoccus mobilis TaxID=415221 RepID=A0A934RYT4_9BACT|nr:CRTAC1 family protein [Pelagicoccus mobilis]MBK1879227.1 CRTAC1 family protein [Pelagicoccus mobilis]
MPTPRFLQTISLLLLSALPKIEAADIDPILSQRQNLDSSVWEQERLAQEYETAFIQLWDRMRAQSDQSKALEAFDFDQLLLPNFEHKQSYKEGIKSYKPVQGSDAPLSKTEFQSLIQSYRDRGFQIEQSEWHHARFDAPQDGSRNSLFTFALHAQGPSPQKQRYILRGKLKVAWRSEATNGIYQPDTISIEDMDILTRRPTPTFKHTEWLESKRNTTPYGIVLVEDLNKDGLPDIAFPRYNVLYLNKGNFEFEKTLLAKYMIRGLPTAAFFADLNLDGKTEYVVATHDTTYLFAYTFNPLTKSFDGKPFGIWKSDTPLKVGLLAAGDITGDGYPEIYLGQSAPAYENGKVPTPYFDANDGRPAFLLKNDRNLRFEDITEQSSVAEKRGRRAFTASFQDLNGDQRMELLVTADFSGVDIHENQNGTLVEKTSEYLDDRSLFGMSHAFADFDRDGTKDLLAVGMSSTTARRLEQMGLGREEFPEHQAMRMRIAKGNRLYYGSTSPNLSQQPASEDIARSGWSWGNSTFDFNNDSFPDIFIANGYLSRSTARDYCTNFWTHDIYEGTSFSQDQLDSFYTEFGPEALVGKDQMGWNPFEKDHLYLNLDGAGFVNASYLFGLSHGGDGRAVVDADFDRDGRQDLLLIELNSAKSFERVHLYRNQMIDTGNWIGIDLQQARGKALLGTRVILECPEFQTERIYTHGETFSGQRPPTLHFGLGEIEDVSRIRIIWPDGETSELTSPRINRYHQATQISES